MKLKTQYPKIKPVLSHPITRFTLIAIGVIAAYGELWSLLSYALYPKIGALYYPWDALMLALNHEANPQKINSILTLTFVSPIVFIAWLLTGNTQKKELKTLHGNAHFASYAEIKKMGLFEPGDIIVGWYKKKLLMEKLISHLLVFAPSRSGKGVSQVIPNALCYKGSLLVTDMKQEVYEYTSGFRAKYGQKVYLFAPGNPNRKSHCWNPLDILSEDKGIMIAQLQNIVEILVKKSGKESDQMWVNEARALALGLLLWLKDSGRPFTIGELNSLLKGTADLSAYLKETVNNAVISEQLLAMDYVAYMNINNFIQKSDKEQSGVKSSLTSCLTLWDDPYINAATAKSDFDIRKMREEPMTVYLGIPANEISRLAPLMNLFIQQFVSVLSANIPNPKKEPYRVLAILDEFCNLGKMENIRKGFSYLAGFNIHLMPIIQNIGEFFAIYGKDESDTFFQNTEYKIMYRQNAETDKDFVSRSLGDKTVQINTKSRHQNKNNTSTTSGEDFVKRRLLTPDEVSQLPKLNAILQKGGEPPVKFERIIYHEEKLFHSRILAPVEIPHLAPLYPEVRNLTKYEENKDKK